MKTFIIRLETGEYLTGCRITSNYFSYERTRDRAAADPFNDFDSQLVLKRVLTSGEKNPALKELA